MKAITKIRKLAKKQLRGMSRQQLTKLVGVAPSTIDRFMSGKTGSKVVAKYLADTYGGEFIPLLDQYNLEFSAQRKKQMIHARSVATVRTPSPSDFVEMPPPMREHHHVPKVNIFEFWKPVHVRPEYLTQPEYI